MKEQGEKKRHNSNNGTFKCGNFCTHPTHLSFLQKNKKKKRKTHKTHTHTKMKRKRKRTYFL